MTAALLIAATLSLDVTTKSPFAIVDWESDECPVVTVSNTNDVPLAWKGDVRVEDHYGRGFSLPIDVNLEPGAKKSGRIPRGAGKVDAKGVWTVRTDFGEMTFAVLDARKPTPKIPFGHFRAGINIHYERKLTHEQQLLATDAAMRMGAKIVRALGVFDAPYKWDVMRGWNHTFEWKDTMLQRLEEDGIAVNALFSMMWQYGNIIGPYMTAVAKRYGERFDYYEIGNEWDLIKANEATPMMAAGMQMLCCGALKRGNPKVRVTTNGFAVEDSNGHFNVTQKGFQEEFLPLARGAYDIHAMHLHFPFYDFEKRLDKFFAMRKATGTTEPFVLNECALTTTYRSEESVAENVWQKIVHAWSVGATDLIWYDLVAPTKKVKGGYSMMTLDFHPRLAYAAFSALAKVLENCDYVAKPVAKNQRRVYQFADRKNGRLIFIGWDPALENPVEIPFATDAKRVMTVDVMNNAIGEGASWKLSAAPTAIIFEGATDAKPDMTKLGDAKKAPPHVMDVKPNRHNCGWDLHLFKLDYVHENYPADPFTAHRQWKGKDDLSADVLFVRKDFTSKPLLRITVHDEKDEKDDRVHIYRNGKEITDTLVWKRVRHGDRRTTYEAEWPDFETCRFNIRIDDDDGFGGIDGYMEYVKDSNGDLDLWPILKFK